MTDTIDFSDFMKLDLRVGKIIAGAEPEWSRKLLEFTVDFGEEVGQRTILSGVRQWYSPGDFVGKQYIFVVNLAPKKMGEGISEGMMLMADSEVDGENKPVPIEVPTEATVGDSIR